MSLVVDVRGTNGSGKTTVVSHFIAPPDGSSYRYEEIGPGVMATCRGRVAALGVYKKGVGCGGCDGIRTQAQIRAAVEAAAERFPVVLYEGVIVSTIFRPYLDLARRLQRQGHIHVFAFLQTPLDECLRRIYVRNNGTPIKEDLVRSKFAAIQRVRSKALDAGQLVLDVAGAEDLADLIRGVVGT